MKNMKNGLKGFTFSTISEISYQVSEIIACNVPCLLTYIDDIIMNACVQDITLTL